MDSKKFDLESALKVETILEKYIPRENERIPVRFFLFFLCHIITDNYIINPDKHSNPRHYWKGPSNPRTNSCPQRVAQEWFAKEAGPSKNRRIYKRIRLGLPQ
jgi:hypothetical protein